MNIEDIAKDMARDGYNLKDDGANNRALKEYLQTQAGLDNYKEWITSMLEAQYNSEDTDIRSAKEHTRQGQGSSRRPRRQVLPGAIKKPGDALRDGQR